MNDSFDLRKCEYRPTEAELVAEKERAELKRREEAFWNLPEDEMRRALVVAEEDLPVEYRGGPYRQFRSANVVDLVRVREARKKQHGQ
jgi:hypothetical protein